MTIDVITNEKELKQIEGQWNELLKRSENPQVLHSYQWYTCWMKSFARPREMFILVARDGEKLTAVLPMMKARCGRKGFRINAVKSMTNSRSSLFDLLADRPSGELLNALLHKVFEATRRRVIILEKVRESSLIRKYIAEAAGYGSFLWLLRPVSESWMIQIDQPFAAFFGGRESKFRKNMRAAERKCLSRGPLNVLQPSCLEDLSTCLDRGFVLQSKGWKGREGSAIMQNEQVRSFYRDLAVEGYKKGWLRHMLLCSNGDDMSFMYCLAGFGCIHALEIGMDEQYKNVGAGMVVTKKMLEQAFDEKRYHTWDFGNGQDRWKKDWSNGRELQYTIFVFRNGPIGALYHALARYYHTRHPFQPFDKGEDGRGDRQKEGVA